MSEENFEGLTPEEIEARRRAQDDAAQDRSGEAGEPVPELEAEFMDALREASGEPLAPREEKPAADEQPAAEQPAAESAPPPGGDPGETVEYSPGDAPDDTAGEDSTEHEADSDGEAEKGAAVAGVAATAAAPAVDPSQEQTQILRAGRDEAREAIAHASETGTPWAPKRPPANGDPEGPPKRKRLWLRFVFASLIIVASFASATTAVGVLRLSDIVDDINNIPEKAKNELADVVPGEGQTFLILGSDVRAADREAGVRGLSDTTILLRLDPQADRIAILNIPRDLKTYIPGVGTDKFNAAYAYGGPQLTLRTIKRMTANTGLQINHLVNIDFLGFAQAINAIDCVYIDVDRRYYHSNEGLPASEQYDEINIQPGYQRLCGEDALDYARYRHTDTDLVRAARQQDFLREARERVPPDQLYEEAAGLDDELISIFTEHTSSDIDEPSTIIEVLELMIAARNAQIQEVKFPATLGPSFVYASRSEIAGAVEQFLGFEASGGPRGSLDENDTASAAQEQNQQQKPQNASGPTGSTGASGTTGSTGQAGQPSPAPVEPAPVEKTPTPESDGLVDASTAGLQAAKRAARKASAELPIYYPTRVPPGSEYDDDEVFTTNPRVYHLNDTDDKAHEAYKMVLELFAEDGTHYFGVQGIRDWESPPALDDPSESRTIGDLDVDIFIEGDRVRTISWREDGNSYWLQNSLLQTLTNDQMLGMVRSMRVVEPNEKRQPKKKKKKKG